MKFIRSHSLITLTQTFVFFQALSKRLGQEAIPEDEEVKPATTTVLYNRRSRSQSANRRLQPTVPPTVVTSMPTATKSAQLAERRMRQMVRTEN